MQRVILKAETHASRSDREHEALLLTAYDADALVFEGPEREPVWSGWTWLAAPLFGLFWWVLLPAYASTDVVFEAAERRGVPITRTRVSDRDLLRAVPWPVVGLSLLVFYGGLVGAVVTLAAGAFEYGYSLTLIALLIPVLVMRLTEMVVGGAANRDRVIAECIVEAGTTAATPDQSSTVLAVVGRAHLSGVRAALPETVDVRVERPVWEHPDTLAYLWGVGRMWVRIAMVTVGLGVVSVVAQWVVCGV